MSIHKFHEKLLTERHGEKITEDRARELDLLITETHEFITQMLHPHSERGRLLSTFRAAITRQTTHSSLRRQLPVQTELVMLGGNLDLVPEELKTLQLGYVMKPQLEPVATTLKSMTAFQEKIWKLQEIVTKELLNQEQFDAIDKAVNQLGRREDVDITELLNFKGEAPKPDRGHSPPMGLPKGYFDDFLDDIDGEEPENNK